MKLKLAAATILALAAAAPAYAIMPVEMPRNSDGSARFVDNDDHPFGNGPSGQVFGAANGAAFSGAPSYDRQREAPRVVHQRWQPAYSAISDVDASLRAPVNCLDCDTAHRK